MAANYLLGVQQGPGAGERFASAFQHGMEQNRERSKREAMAALVGNPNDPKALANLARLDPATAMDFRQQNLKYGNDQHEAWAKTVGHAAKMATTPEQWDGIIDQFVANGHPEAAQLKGKFSPALRAAFMAQGGVSDEGSQDPSMIREFEIAKAKGYVPPNTSFTEYATMRSPGAQAPIVLPHNIQQVGGGAPAGGGTSEITATGPNGEKVRLNPQTNQWEPMGGTGGNAGGGFPDPLAPL